VTQNSIEQMEMFKQLIAKRKEETQRNLKASPFHKLSTDFFSRFSRDPEAKAEVDEIIVQPGWHIVHSKNAATVVIKMAGHLADFLDRCMGISLPVEAASDIHNARMPAIILSEAGGGKSGVPESFTIKVTTGFIMLAGADAGGLRSAVVRLIGLMGLRQAPIIKLGETIYVPRIPIRQVELGGIPNDIFYGANAVCLGSYELYELSNSHAIPELAVRRKQWVMEELTKKACLAREYGLKMYVQLSIREKFEKNDPIFEKYPDIRGALTWKADGHYTLCTEHPLVQRYLAESIEGLFRSIPDLDGITIIIGGESFYHCFMRPYGVEKGHTNCKRCEALGAERVVSNLCNMLVMSARRINPEAEVIAWPYSASYVWSADDAQEKFMRLLEPGVSILTEMEKDEIVQKPGGIEKRLWDYSIDLIGPGKRAATQLKVGRETNVPVHILSMAEMSFENVLLPFVPVLDRWVSRSEAIACSGAKGVYLWNMAPFSGLSSGEIYQYKWFSPAPSADALLSEFAKRITGSCKAGELLRTAWREVSNGFAYMPLINSYYKGPHYLGPAHPIVINFDTAIPDIFYGYYLFLAEINPESSIQPLPVYDLNPEYVSEYAGPESLPVLETYYRVVQDHLERAVALLNEADPLIPERLRIVYDAETLPIRWFYHTARTIGNFYESFRLTCKLKNLIEVISTASSEEIRKGENALERLKKVLHDEKQNALDAVIIAGKDARLETLYRVDHSFSKLTDMLHAKIELIDKQIAEEIPKLEKNLKR